MYARPCPRSTCAPRPLPRPSRCGRCSPTCGRGRRGPASTRPPWSRARESGRSAASASGGARRASASTTLESPRRFGYELVSGLPIRDYRSEVDAHAAGRWRDGDPLALELRAAGPRDGAPAPRAPLGLHRAGGAGAGHGGGPARGRGRRTGARRACRGPGAGARRPAGACRPAGARRRPRRSPATRRSVSATKPWSSS